MIADLAEIEVRQNGTPGAERDASRKVPSRVDGMATPSHYRYWYSDWQGFSVPTHSERQAA